jgi:hypothetical protein
MVFSDAELPLPCTLHIAASIPKLSERLSLAENEKYVPLIPLISGYKPVFLCCHSLKVSKSKHSPQSRKQSIPALTC